MKGEFSQPKNNALKRVAVWIAVGAMGIWVVVLIITWYIVSSNQATLAFWVENENGILLVILLSVIEARMALVLFRLGVVQKWSATNELAWYAKARPRLIMEWVLYLFAAVILVTGLVIQSWLLQYPGWVAGFGLGITFVVLSSYFAGRRTSSEMLSSIEMHSWFIPVTGRFHGTLQVPSIEISWKSRSQSWALEKSLIFGMGFVPISVLAVIALIARGV